MVRLVDRCQQRGIALVGLFAGVFTCLLLMFILKKRWFFVKCLLIGFSLVAGLLFSLYLLSLAGVDWP